MFQIQLTPSPACPCGYIQEDTAHYILWCPLYTYHRSQLFIKMRRIIPDFDNLSSKCKLSTLLFGINLTTKQGIRVAYHLQSYIGLIDSTCNNNTQSPQTHALHKHKPDCCRPAPGHFLASIGCSAGCCGAGAILFPWFDSRFLLMILFYLYFLLYVRRGALIYAFACFCANP